MSGRQGMIHYITKKMKVGIILCFVFTGGKKKPLKNPKKDQQDLDEVFLSKFY